MFENLYSLTADLRPKKDKIGKKISCSFVLRIMGSIWSSFHLIHYEGLPFAGDNSLSR